MTAEAFAALVNARRTDLGRWQARCPAHRDSSPSLSIREGSDGRVLVNCFAGCSHTAIVAALGLSARELFAGNVPLSPAEQSALRILQDGQQAAKRAERTERIAAFDRARRWEAIVERLGAKLAHTPEADGAEVTRLFHQASERQRQAWMRHVCPKWRAGE
jgi:hypothetical protein